MEATKDGTKERIQMFEGLVIRVSSGMGSDKTMTVRKIASGVGVERLFPIHSSNIAKIEIVGHAKVTSGKLYYMRERTGKSARLKEGKMLAVMPIEEGETVTEEAIAEAVEAKAEEEAAVAAVETVAEETPAEESAPEEEAAVEAATEETVAVEEEEKKEA